MAILTTKDRVTHKPHECWGCRRELPAGTKMRVVTEDNQGTLSSWYWCPVCTSWLGHYDLGDAYEQGGIIDNDPDGWNAEARIIAGER